MTIFTIEKIYKAYNDCLKNKKSTVNALRFETDREKKLFKLLKDLQTRRYKISKHICFVVTIPTTREIFAADFRDRIVHHLLFNEIREIFENDFIEESYANRVGKGTHGAVKKIKFYMVRGGINRQKLYFLKMDIKGFFRNIDKGVLFNEIKSVILKSNKDCWWKDEILWLLEIIIFHDPTTSYVFKGSIKNKNIVPRSKSLFFGDRNKGLPIGNLTSQFFANIYLNKLDHFIKEDLGFYRYVRYVDDFVVLDEDKQKLEETIKKVNKFIEEQLKITLSKDKIFLMDIGHGLDFLGYYIKPTHTLVRRKVVKRFKDKMIKNKNKDNGLYSLEFLPVIKSYYGHFEHANSFNLIKKFDSF